MATIRELLIKIGADPSGLKAGVAQSISSVTGLSTKTLAAGAAIGGAFAAIGAAAIKIGKDFQDADRQIQVATGASGRTLKQLGMDARNAFARLPSDIRDVAGVLGTLNTAFGITGRGLEDLTVQVSDVSRLLGEEAAGNAKQFANALQQFGVPVEAAGQQLDFFYTLTQRSDIGLGDLTARVSEFGPVAKQLGFNIAETADLFSRLEDVGISVSRVMPGLNRALRDMAKAGEEPRETFNRLIESIKNAESQTEALRIATELFGAEGAVRLTQAIRDNVIALDELGEGFTNATGAVEKAADEQQTLGEAFGQLTNNVTLLLEPLGTDLVKALTAVTEGFIELFGVTRQQSEISNELFVNIAKETQAIKDLAKEVRAAASEQDQYVASGQRVLPLSQDLGESTEQWRARVEKLAAEFGVLTPEVEKHGEVVGRTAEQLDAWAKAQEAVNEHLSDMQGPGKTAYDLVVDMTVASAAQADTLVDVEREMSDLNEELEELARKQTAAHRATMDTTRALFDEAVASQHLGESWSRDMNVALEQMGKIPDEMLAVETATKDTNTALTQVSTAVTDLGKDIADLIIHGGKVTDVFKSFGETLLRIASEQIMGALIKELGTLLGMIPGVGGALSGIFGGGGGGLGAALGGLFGGGGGGGAANAATLAGSVGGPIGAGLFGGGGSGASGGLMGALNPISAISGIATGIIGIFQSSAMNENLQLAEEQMRRSAQFLGDRADGGIIGQLFRIADTLEFGTIVKVLEEIRNHTLIHTAVLEQMRDMMQGGVGIIATAGETIVSESEAIADSMGQAADNIEVMAESSGAIRTRASKIRDDMSEAAIDVELGAGYLDEISGALSESAPRMRGALDDSASAFAYVTTASGMMAGDAGEAAGLIGEMADALTVSSPRMRGALNESAAAFEEFTTVAAMMGDDLSAARDEIAQLPLAADEIRQAVLAYQGEWVTAFAGLPDFGPILSNLMAGFTGQISVGFQQAASDAESFFASMFGGLPIINPQGGVPVPTTYATPASPATPTGPGLQPVGTGGSVLGDLAAQSGFTIQPASFSSDYQALGSFQHGGPVPRDMIARLHQGEYVVPADGARGITVVVNAYGVTTEQAIDQMVGTISRELAFRVREGL